MMDLRKCFSQKVKRASINYTLYMYIYERIHVCVYLASENERVSKVQKCISL